jgi:hypothetical protein
VPGDTDGPVFTIVLNGEAVEPLSDVAIGEPEEAEELPVAVGISRRCSYYQSVYPRDLQGHRLIWPGRCPIMRILTSKSNAEEGIMRSRARTTPHRYCMDRRILTWYIAHSTINSTHTSLPKY